MISVCVSVVSESFQHVMIILFTVIMICSYHFISKNTCSEIFVDAWRRTRCTIFDICSRIHPTSSCTSGSHSRSLHMGYAAVNQIIKRLVHQFVPFECLYGKYKNWYRDSQLHKSVITYQNVYTK